MAIKLARAAAALSFVSGLLVLIGWQFSIQILKVLPGTKVAMNPASALSFLSVGVALLLLTAPRRSAQSDFIAQVFASLAIAIAATRILGFWFWDASLDQVLYASQLDSNRMAPNTALCFVLCGASLLSLDFRPRGICVSNFFAVASLAVSLLALTGYFYGVEALYGVATFTPMALNTGLTFFVLSLGLFAARPEYGVAAQYLVDDLGGAMVRRIWPFVVGVPLVFGFLYLFGQRAGLYNYEFGVSLLVVCTMLALSLFTWFAARRLSALDQTVQLQKQVQQLQKLDAIGRLAGGIAHDFNNILGAIQMYCDFLAESAGQGPAIADSIGEMNKAVQRGAGLTRQLLVFSRAGRAERSAVCLDELVTDQVRMLERLIGEDKKIELRLGAQKSAVHADPGQLEQVVMNLVLNARDAISKYGTITIETKEEEIQAEFIADMYLMPANGRYLMLSVTDTGSGMDEATKTQIFEPFFTTKAIGKGVGLGLATVFGIVKSYNGGIWLYSIPGKGTVFKIYFPVIDAVENVKKDEPVIDLRGTETILLVEDEHTLRTLYMQSLEQLGYTVLVAADGREALSLIALKADQIDLLLTDIVMPNMGGIELIEQVRERFSKIRILCMSGYPGDLNGADFKEAFLQKPFNKAILARKVRELLASLQ